MQSKCLVSHHSAAPWEHWATKMHPTENKEGSFSAPPTNYDTMLISKNTQQTERQQWKESQFLIITIRRRTFRLYVTKDPIQASVL